MVQVYRLDDIASEAWKNGGGTTRTLAREGDDWRISLARIERDGPYSSFPGMLRLSLILRGAGIGLRHGDHTVALLPGVPAHFDGEPVWQASLQQGACEALNVMVRKNAFQVCALPLPSDTRIPGGAAALVLANGATLHVGAARVRADEYAVVPAAGAPLPVQVQPCGQGAAYLILIEPAGSSKSIRSRCRP